jgi:hypothetical protein
VSIVAQRLTQFSDEIRKVGVRDESIRPEQGVELLLRNGFRATLDENGKERERLRRDVHRFPAAENLAGVRVKLAVTESKAHIGAR